MSASRRIGRALGRLLRAVASAAPTDVRPDVRPACEFGLVVEERLRDLQEDMAGIRNLLRAVLLAIIAGLIGLAVDIIMRGIL